MGRSFSASVKAGMPASKSEDQIDAYEQRSTYEDILKLSAQQLSNKTDGETLVKLLRMVSFVPPTSNTLELASELCTYLKPKLFALENADLCNVHTALVLLPKQDP